ncbi:hypothetical protein ABC733_03530 [Mangrovibacter sp. SLW1]
MVQKEESVLIVEPEKDVEVAVSGEGNIRPFPEMRASSPIIVLSMFSGVVALATPEQANKNGGSNCIKSKKQATRFFLNRGEIHS